MALVVMAAMSKDSPERRAADVRPRVWAMRNGGVAGTEVEVVMICRMELERDAMISVRKILCNVSVSGSGSGSGSSIGKFNRWINPNQTASSMYFI